MSLDFALEKYPVETRLRDKTGVVVRPIRKADCAALQKFFYAVPEPERLFIERPITDKALFEKWCKHRDFERDMALVLLDKGKIIGWIHMRIPQGGWKRHIGHLTFLTHPNYRGRDVSLVLLQEIMTIARFMGVWKLEAELNGERKTALRSLQHLGFEELYCLNDYVIDMTRQSHDYVVMGIDLKTDEEYAGLG